jgi:hypothetical protein
VGETVTINEIGARLGNWNDRNFHPDTRADRTFVYKAIDRVAGRLFVLGES